MKKLIDFSKSYLAEILFALVSLCTISLALYGVVCKGKTVALLVLCAAAIIQIVAGWVVGFVMKAQIKKLVWHAYFALAAAVLGVGALIADNPAGFWGSVGCLCAMAKQYEGRFPTKDEIEQIYAKFNEINQNLYECGESLLRRRRYLYTSGDEDADGKMNYCLDFATGQQSLANCDSVVGAVLVE